jgi:hypothetical protein
VFDAKDGNILEIKYGNDSLVQHIPTIDLAIEELNDNMVIVSGQMDVLNVWKTDLINNILTSIDNRLDSLETNKEDKSNKNIADGYAGLDHNVKIPLNLIPDSLLGKADYKGLWDASVNIPDLTEIKPKGDYYIVGVNGTFLGVDYVVKDWIISNGTSWDKVDNTDAVSSVQGRTGNVVLTKADVGLGNAQDTSDVNKPVSTATQTELNKKLDKTGGQMTGNIGLLKYEEKIGTATGGVCDLSTGNIFNIPVSANTTLSFTNVSATTGYAQSVVLYLVMAGTYSVTFPASVKWHNGALPDISAIKTHEIVCRTLDNGVTWLASLGGSF